MPLVLVVEDIAFEREQLRDLLQRAGYTCAEAADGLEALDSISAHPPDCILTDLTMPEMDGFELLRALREDRIGIPVIVLTADRHERTRRECEHLGALAVLHKPWAPRLLREIIRRALAGRTEGTGEICSRPAGE